MEQDIIRTVLGDIPVSNIGMILPHEHLFTDLRGPGVEDYAQANTEEVTNTMLPLLAEAEVAGVTALFECSTMGVGRNIHILKALADKTKIHLVAPTGVYREAYIPEIFLRSSVEDLVKIWVHEITHSIEASSVKAGFIKIAVSDDGPTDLEERNIRAAARTSLTTGAAIACHTIGGPSALEVIEILEREQLNLQKFIWVHADSETDLDYHREVVEKGAYVEFDSLGQPGKEPKEHIQILSQLIGENKTNQILLSHDAGWFQPGQPGGKPEGGMRGFTNIGNVFIPELLQAGFDRSIIAMLTEQNPKSAFALQVN